MPLEVRESIAAKRDRLSIWLYIANESVAAADRLIDDILSISRRMGEFPESGERNPQLGRVVLGVPLGNYMIYYRIVADCV